jgi:CheY-like chemotaxis protein
VSIVYVDDDARVLASITELLIHLGLSVRAFDNGPDALRSIESDMPDAALIDLNMPGMDGFEVAAEIRGRLSRKLRLVAFTGVASKGQRSAAALAGFDVFLIKPCSGSAIVRALQGHYE